MTLLPKHTPWRDKSYLAYVRDHCCIGCEKKRRIIAHHDGPGGGRGMKCGDQFTVPLCEPLPGGGCHGYIHHDPYGRLPELTARQTAARIRDAQWRLMSRWIIGDRAGRNLFPGDRKF